MFAIGEEMTPQWFISPSGIVKRKKLFACKRKMLKIKRVLSTPKVFPEEYGLNKKVILRH
jgi:hypothetical protein